MIIKYFFQELRSLLSKILRRDPKARIDMETLRSDPWVNYEEAEPPIRIMPKVTGPPDPSHLGQLIRSINRDSSFVVFTIRQHMRNGVNIDGASVEKNKTLQKSVAAAATAQNAPSGYHGGRRRSHSMGPPTHANIGMAGGAASASPSSPNRIGEDDEEEIGRASEFCCITNAAFANPCISETINVTEHPKSTHVDARNPVSLDLHQLLISRPPPNEGVRENFFPPRTSAVAQTPQPPSSQPPQRQRRNTITTLFKVEVGSLAPEGFLARFHQWVVLQAQYQIALVVQSFFLLMIVHFIVLPAAADVRFRERLLLAVESQARLALQTACQHL
ncbi:hypothetical protein BC829DRAFT_176462 [Chytridium lagenaria]|nr:hypothetical protein BC829DRAFT_176462 [Chytridium lagenaria]